MGLFRYLYVRVLLRFVFCRNVRCFCILLRLPFWGLVWRLARPALVARMQDGPVEGWFQKKYPALETLFFRAFWQRRCCKTSPVTVQALLHPAF